MPTPPPRIAKALAGLSILGLAAAWLACTGGDSDAPDDTAKPKHPAHTAAPDAGRLMAAASAPEAADAAVPSQPPSAATPSAGPATARPVGSEGYGPTILAALHEGGPLDAYRAAALINRCKGIDRDVEAVFKLGESPDMQKKRQAYLQTLDYVQTEQRRCQTVAGELANSRPQLLRKATEGHVLGAAALYIAEMQDKGGVDAGARDTTVRALRRDGELGDTISLLTLWSAGAELSGSESDRRAFKLAYQLISDKYPDEATSRFVSLLQQGAVAEGWGDVLANLFKRDEASAEEKARAAAILARYERRRQAVQPGRT